MTDDRRFPESVQIDAWAGDKTVVDRFRDLNDRWGLAEHRNKMAFSASLAPPRPPDWRDWRDPRVGWGLIAPAAPGVPEADQARGVDLAAPFQCLLAGRPGSPVFRCIPGVANAYMKRVYADGRPSKDIQVAAAATGVGDLELPRYLLIAAGPDTIPWRQQYLLNMCRAVGRLDPAEPGLGTYIDHLLADWGGSRCVPMSPVLWSVNHGPADITDLLQKVIADPLWAKFSSDTGFKAVRMVGALATGDRLAEALRLRPDLVVTTSHGMTGSPTGTAANLLDVLGMPADASHEAIEVALGEDTVPGGAIWYAHACCSAGSDQQSYFADLFPAGTAIGDVLRDVSTKAGSRIGALPRRLLNAKEPIRAFVGHVEPTFDWTLSDPLTGNSLAASLANAFYERIYQPGMPVGLALANIYAESGRFFAEQALALEEINRGNPRASKLAAYQRIAALDRQSLVLIGDPTVTLAKGSG